MAKNRVLEELEKRSTELHAEIPSAKPSEVFAAAIEAGYLTAIADGTLDDEERVALARAIELLSKGAVIEWETDALLEGCAARAKDKGAKARAEEVGRSLAASGQAEAGLLVGAIVACATNGVDKTEADTLKQVAKAAGVSSDKLRGIVKRAAGFAGT